MRLLREIWYAVVGVVQVQGQELQDWSLWEQVGDLHGMPRFLPEAEETSILIKFCLHVHVV